MDHSIMTLRKEDLGVTGLVRLSSACRRLPELQVVDTGEVIYLKGSQEDFRRLEDELLEAHGCSVDYEDVPVFDSGMFRRIGGWIDEATRRLREWRQGSDEPDRRQ